MFTSRAEFRTLLRQDNADLRLTEKSYRMGLASQERMDKVKEKQEGVEKIKTILKELPIDPEDINQLLIEKNTAPLTQRIRAYQILLRPSMDIFIMKEHVAKMKSALAGFNNETLEQAEIQVKYEVYIEKENELVKKMSQLEDLVIPDSFDYAKLVSLSTEARQKFNRIRPRTLGQASRISGVNPSDVQILMVYMGR
jgi:tRNA uridine 5-carboxymethylaminomethyl modification enzyme